MYSSTRPAENRECLRKGGLPVSRNLSNLSKAQNCSTPQNSCVPVSQHTASPPSRNQNASSALHHQWQAKQALKVPASYQAVSDCGHSTLQETPPTRTSLQRQDAFPWDNNKAEVAKRLLTGSRTHGAPTQLCWTIAVNPHETSSGAHQERISEIQNAVSLCQWAFPAQHRQDTGSPALCCNNAVNDLGPRSSARGLRVKATRQPRAGDKASRAAGSHQTAIAVLSGNLPRRAWTELWTKEHSRHTRRHC